LTIQLIKGFHRIAARDGKWDVIFPGLLLFVFVVDFLFLC